MVIKIVALLHVDRVLTLLIASDATVGGNASTSEASDFALKK